MLKNKRLLIIIAVISIILICTFIGFLIVKITNNDKKIAYINPEEGDVDKLAFIINGDNEKFAVTIDEQYTVNANKNYFEKNDENDNFNVEISSSIYDMVNITNDNMEIEVMIQDIYNEKSEVIKKDGRWVLLKDRSVAGSEVTYNIYYCAGENYNISEEKDFIDNIIFFKNIKDVKEEKAIKEYENIKSKVNVYKVVEEEEKIIFEDFEEKQVDLSNYQFIRDLITKSLFNYDLYIRNPKGIKESVEKIEVWYNVPNDENETQYKITICDEKFIEENREYAAFVVDYKFEHNDREYEVMTTELGGSLNFYTKIEENQYIYIFMKGQDIDSQSIKENIEIFVERIKEQVL